MADDLTVNFLTITEADKNLNLARALVSREMEIHQYDINIANYTAILASLPTDEWPDDVSEYKNQPIENVPTNLQSTVADYSFRDRLRDLLSTENLERSKSVRVYNAIKSQIPADQITELVTKAMAPPT